MAVTIECSVAADVASAALPDEATLLGWVRAAVDGRRGAAHVDLRICGEEEMTRLNRDWRGKDGPTNVLSFPVGDEAPRGLPLLGDIALCAPVVAAEAAAQGKDVDHHWAHLVVHGVLHLLGFDHMEADAAEEMEAIERRLLASLGIADPYAYDD